MKKAFAVWPQKPLIMLSRLGDKRLKHRKFFNHGKWLGDQIFINIDGFAVKGIRDPVIVIYGSQVNIQILDILIQFLLIKIITVIELFDEFS